MSNEEEYNVAARYSTVRKHLNSLGYKQAISLDALPLIEKLLADLIQTTESLKHFKCIAQENIEAYSQLQLAVDPYKCDNARLVQECNQLHSDLIEAKESHQKQVKDLKKEIYRLECECNDLQLASSCNLHRIKELETESSKKSKKILELQGKCLKPTISNVGLAVKKRPCYPLRRPVLESEPLPKASGKVTPLPNLSNVEPKILDLLSMADHRMNCLTHEVTKLKGDLSMQIDSVNALKSQLTIKEKEITRLKKMLEGGRPYTAVTKDCACKKTEHNFVTSNDNTKTNDLRVLQQEKVELEHQLKEALNKQHSAMSQALKLAERNEELEKELRDIDHIALAVEADCNSVVKENNKRVCKLQEKLQDVMTQVHVLEGELTVERKEVQELRADLEACKIEKRNIQRTLDFAVDEKKQMTDRINELTIIEKSLNDEIERLVKENVNQRQDNIQLQYINKKLKDQVHKSDIMQGSDGDDLKRVKQKGEKNDHNKASKSHRDMFSTSTMGQNETEYEGTCNNREFAKDANGTRHSELLKRLSEKETHLTILQQSIAQLRNERDYYREEYNNIKDQHNSAMDKDNMDLWTRIRELKRELSKKEVELNELQREKKELNHEKVNLETSLQVCRNEHRKFCRPCSTCKHAGLCKCPLSPPTVKDSSITKAMLEHLEHERDIARSDVERLIEERDALRERLKLAVEAHTSEQRRLRENLVDVETRLKHIEKERQDLLLTQGTRRAAINGLEDQLDDMREELRKTKQELATQRTQYLQLRALQDQTDQALGDVQNQLGQSETELNKAIDRNKMMERQQAQLDSQTQALRQEIDTLSSNITHLDHEKDQLLMVLDEKTERIAALEREVISREQQTVGLQQQMREMQHKNEICVDQSAEQERQLRSMQSEMESLQRQLQAASSDRENAIQENRRLQDDLAAVTCEVRNLQRELEASRAESYDLKRQLQTYVSEVRRAEDLLNRKENERTEMLNHFRSLSLEATVLENNNHSLESEAAEARGALQTARDRLLDLERQLADRDCLIRGYETQISELTQNVASMETQMRQQGEQRHRAEADLCAVRDLCVKLDQQKDTLMLQLDDKDTLKSQFDAQIARMKAEQGVIQDQMNRDRATVERLETLLDQARQESINAQTNNQELQNEMSRMKQKISELQSRLSAESAELRQYQNQAAEYSKQISELRRQVTNERFDRARKDEENRRHSEGSSITLLHQESPQNPTQSARSNIRPHNEWNGTTTHRYLQEERNREHSALPAIGSRIEGTSGFHAVNDGCRINGKIDNRRLKDTNKICNNSGVNNDVRCINIILNSSEFNKNTSTISRFNEGLSKNIVPLNIADANESTEKNYDGKKYKMDSTRNIDSHRERGNYGCNNERIIVNGMKDLNLSRISNWNEQQSYYPVRLLDKARLQSIVNNGIARRLDNVKGNEVFFDKFMASDNLVERKVPYLTICAPLKTMHSKSSMKKPEVLTDDKPIKNEEETPNSMRGSEKTPAEFRKLKKSSRESDWTKMSAVKMPNNIDEVNKNKQYSSSTPQKFVKPKSEEKNWIEISAIKTQKNVDKVNGNKKNPASTLVNLNSKPTLKVKDWPEIATIKMQNNIDKVTRNKKNPTSTLLNSNSTSNLKEEDWGDISTIKMEENTGEINNNKEDFTDILPTNVKSNFQAKSRWRKHSNIVAGTDFKSNFTTPVHDSSFGNMSKGINHRNASSKFSTSINPHVMLRNKKMFIHKGMENSNLRKGNICKCNDHDRNLPLFHSSKIHSDEIKLGDKGLTKHEESCTNADGAFKCPESNAVKHFNTFRNKIVDANTAKSDRVQINVESQNNNDTLGNKNVNISKNVNMSDGSSTDNTLEMLTQILNGIEKLKNYERTRNTRQNRSEEEEKSNDKYSCGIEQNEETEKEFTGSTLNLLDFTRPEFINILREIKERTKKLEEQLTIMNRHMKMKAKTKEKPALISERHRENEKGFHKQKDELTQQPDKKNVSVQEPNQMDKECLQKHPTSKAINTNSNQQIARDDFNVKVQDINVQQIEENKDISEFNEEISDAKSVLQKRTVCMKDHRDLNPQIECEKHFKQDFSATQMKSDELQLNDERTKLKVCVNSIKSLEYGDIPEMSEESRTFCSSYVGRNTQDGILSSRREFYDNETRKANRFSAPFKSSEYNSSEMANKQVDPAVNSTISSAVKYSKISGKPIAESTPKNRTLSKKQTENNSQTFSDTNTQSSPKENLHFEEEMKLTEPAYSGKLQKSVINSTTNDSYEEKSEHEKKSNSELQLANDINNILLKLKYKKSIPRRFRSKCIVCSPALRDQTSRHKTSKGKLQTLPNSLRQWKLSAHELEHGSSNFSINYGSNTCNRNTCKSASKHINDTSVKSLKCCDNLVQSKTGEIFCNLENDGTNLDTVLSSRTKRSDDKPDLFATVFTQSSNLQIIAATSVSSVTLNRKDENVNDTRTNKDVCILS